MKAKPIKFFITTLIVMISAMVFSVAVSAAEIVLPDIISDHMLIQQGEEISLWGTAGSGEKVEVTISANGRVYQEGTATADEAGSFMVKLSAMNPGGPYEILFETTTDSVTVYDVVIGELWIQCGQSNMAKTTSGCGTYTSKILPDSPINDIRLFMNTTDNQMTERATNLEGEWKIADSESVKSFSALGYCAIKEIHDDLQIPVGGICVAVSGKMMSYFKGPSTPGEAGGKLYNSKFAPLTNMAVRGVMWHQFEGDRDNAKFKETFVNLVNSWRLDRNDDDLHVVYFTANPSPMKYIGSSGEYVVRDWSLLRLEQIKAYYDLDNVSFIVTTDFPFEEQDTDLIHPKNKLDTGKRMGQTVLGAVYGRNNTWQSPLYKVSSKGNGYAEVTFSNTYGGLKTDDGLSPRHFLVGETNGVWKEPSSVEIIDDDTIRISCDVLDEINYISYCVEAHLYPYTSVDDAVSNTYVDVNVVNSANLPLAPFVIEIGESKAEKEFTDFAEIPERIDTAIKEPLTVVDWNADGDIITVDFSHPVSSLSGKVTLTRTKGSVTENLTSAIAFGENHPNIANGGTIDFNTMIIKPDGGLSTHKESDSEKWVYKFTLTDVKPIDSSAVSNLSFYEKSFYVELIDNAMDAVTTKNDENRDLHFKQGEASWVEAPTYDSIEVSNDTDKTKIFATNQAFTSYYSATLYKFLNKTEEDGNTVYKAVTTDDRDYTVKAKFRFTLPENPVDADGNALAWNSGGYKWHKKVSFGIGAHATPFYGSSYTAINAKNQTGSGIIFNYHPYYYDSSNPTANMKNIGIWVKGEANTLNTLAYVQDIRPNTDIELKISYKDGRSIAFINNKKFADMTVTDTPGVPIIDVGWRTHNTSSVLPSNIEPVEISDYELTLAHEVRPITVGEPGFDDQTVLILVENPTETDKEILAICALYDENDALSQIIPISNTVVKGNAKEFAFKDLDTDGIKYIRVFVWNGITLEPYQEKIPVMNIEN
ncbi:MAG: hypothetical protein IJD91_07150 [Clostridia bacterium]|nr:hypothetical protein [Clostridia bacterium]